MLLATLVGLKEKQRDAQAKFEEDKKRYRRERARAEAEAEELRLEVSALIERRGGAGLVWAGRMDVWMID